MKFFICIAVLFAVASAGDVLEKKEKRGLISSLGYGYGSDLTHDTLAYGAAPLGYSSGLNYGYDSPLIKSYGAPAIVAKTILPSAPLYTKTYATAPLATSYASSAVAHGYSAVGAHGYSGYPAVASHGYSAYPAVSGYSSYPAVGAVGAVASHGLGYGSPLAYSASYGSYPAYNGGLNAGYGSYGSLGPVASAYGSYGHGW